MLTEEQITAAKLAFAEIEIAARTWEIARRSGDLTALGCKEYLLQLLRRHRTFCEAIVPAVVASMENSSAERCAIYLGNPAARLPALMPKAEALNFLKAAPDVIGECFESSDRDMEWSAALTMLAVFARAIADSAQLKPATDGTTGKFL